MDRRSALCTFAVLASAIAHEEHASESAVAHLLRGNAMAKTSNASVDDVVRYRITRSGLEDKMNGFWIGQLVGNFMGLPFEFIYNDDPMPIIPDKYYDIYSAKAAGLGVNTDGRGYIPAYLDKLQGAYTDDDTDIEFVTLHAVEDKGLEITWPDIASYWKKYVHIHVNGGDALWFANRKARELMNWPKSLVPPATGSQENNKWWWTIDPQLVNEIWSAFYPGMVEEAVSRAEWGAKITSASWGTHPTMFYAALYSAAFFVTDVSRLYDIAMHEVPSDSPFLQALYDVKDLHASEPNWRVARQTLKDKYLMGYPSDCGGVPWNCGVSAMINGVMGAMALLYGNGDFMQTVGLAIAAGFDCDNQAATLAGLLGVMYGGSHIPRPLTHEIYGNNWADPFNDRYVNERRLPLPKFNSNQDIADRITNIARDAILANGGSEEHDGTEMAYYVPVSPLLVNDVGAPARVQLPPREGCCTKCFASNFCSDDSQSCYITQAKPYYRRCQGAR